LERAIFRLEGFWFEGFGLEGFGFTHRSRGLGRLGQKYGTGVCFFKIFCFEIITSKLASVQIPNVLYYPEC